MNKALKIAIIVVLCLIVILTITLFACQGDNDKNTTTTTTTTTTSSTSGNGGDQQNPPEDCTEHVDENKDNVCDKCEATLEEPECTEHVDADKNGKCDKCEATVEEPECTEHVDADKNGKCDNCDAAVESAPVDPDEFTETNDKVYVISEGLHIRSSAEKTEENKLGWVEQDTKLERLGYYANGWSKIKYEDKECYVSTDCLTTSKPITSFTALNETVYFIHSALAFTKPSHIEDYSVADFSFFEGEEVKRTGKATEKYVAEDGKEYTFARIEFTVTENGESKTITRYVNNDYLSTTKPTDTDPDGDIEFTESSDILVVKEETGSIKVRKSTIYVAGSEDEVVGSVDAGAELQAVAKGTESDGTIWYKVQYEDSVCYVIYQAKGKDPYFSIKTPSNEQ